MDDPGFDLSPLVRPLGAAGRRDRLGRGGGHWWRWRRARPSYDVLAFEVWRPGVAGTLWRLEEAGVDNVRLISVDAVWSMRHLFAPGSIAELWTFFPDPWPKTRHHKRRLVQPAFAHDAATALLAAGGPGGWRPTGPSTPTRCATVLDAEPMLSGGVTERWEERPLTRFERRGLDEGRAVTDLTYRRV